MSEKFEQLMAQHLKDDKESFSAIQKTLEEMNKKLDEHIQKVEPYLQGAAGFGILWKIVVAIGGMIVLWMQVKDFFVSK